MTEEIFRLLEKIRTSHKGPGEYAMWTEACGFGQKKMLSLGVKHFGKVAASTWFTDYGDWTDSLQYSRFMKNSDDSRKYAEYVVRMLKSRFGREEGEGGC
jgi:hypothetical protein